MVETTLECRLAAPLAVVRLSDVGRRSARRRAWSRIPGKIGLLVVRIKSDRHNWKAGILFANPDEAMVRQ